MDFNQKQLVISYAGSLTGYQPSIEKKEVNPDLRLPYRVDNINYNTRCGYYIFKGIERLIQKYNIRSSEIKIQFWGDISNINKYQVIDMQLNDYVFFDSYLSKDNTIKRLELSDILFLPLESEKNGQKPLFIPGKLFEYLKIGKPILALAGESDVNDILVKSGLGIVCSSFNEEMIADKLFFLLENKERLNELFKPDKKFIETFSFKNKTNELANVFDSLL